MDELIYVENKEQFNEFKAYFQDEGLSIASNSSDDSGLIVKLSDNDTYHLPKPCWKWIQMNTSPIEPPVESPYANDLIYGIDKTENIVSIDAKDDKLYIFQEINGEIKLTEKPLVYWVMSNAMPSGEFTELEGNLHFKYMKEFKTAKQKQKALQDIWKAKVDKYTVYNHAESAMVRYGYTYFKNMKVEDVSILSFDIETNKTLDPKLPHSKTLLIANTFRRNGEITRKLFALDDYKNELCMIIDWCKWVCEMNPSSILGHNVYSFDFYYLHHRLMITQKTQVGFNDTKLKLKGLPIGRDGSVMDISKKVSQFRYDGSQSYDYHKIEIFGREIIDSFFLSMKYDQVKRDFPSYGLKNIIKHLGLEKEDRIIWDWENDDPAKIWEEYSANRGCSCGTLCCEPGTCPACEAIMLWLDYKDYCEADADDALTLYDLMIPSYFYTTTYLPISLQNVLLTATGRWINSFMCRAYLNIKHSIPKPNEQQRVYGGISTGIPGVYNNVVKVDVKSMYPSIIRHFKIVPRGKDPYNYFYQMVDFFTEERFRQKAKYEETGDKYFDDLQSSSKIFINSAFGTLGTSGLHFNDFGMADKITGIGRQIIRKTIKWATGNDIGDYMEYDYNKDIKYDRQI